MDFEGNQITDFCNTGYLSFEYEDEIHQRGCDYSRKWGSISGWSRMEIDPHIYGDFEERLKQFLGCEDVVLSQTVTITNFSIMSYLAGKGIIFTDKIVHSVVWESCRLARDHGAMIQPFNHQDLNDLEEKLKKNKNIFPKIIAVDGVYSISSEYAPIDDLVQLAKKYDAYVYVDDAHGLGVLGENPSSASPYGKKGNGVARFFNTDYERVLYVSSFGKAFGSSVAFITIPPFFRDNFRSNFTQYLFSAPPCPYQIGCVDAGLDLNERVGDERRAKIHDLTKYFCDELKKLNLKYYNNGHFPVVFVELGEFENLYHCAALFKKAGIIPGFRAYPVVPPDQCGMRFAMTASHCQDDVSKVIDVFSTFIKKSKNI